MKTIILVLFLASNFAFAQMNQTGVAVIGTLENLVKLPEEIFFGISKPFRQKKYKNLVERTTQSADQPVLAGSCEERCPDTMHLLQNRRQQMMGNEGAYLLGFLNEKADFADHIQRNVGYCWGHSSVTRSMNYLTFFDPAQEIEKAPLETDSEEFIKFYRRKIKKIMRYKAQVIPGFHNIREFSSHPIIQRLLKDSVVWGWADKALRLRAVPAFIKGFKGQMTPEKLEDFLQQVEAKLAVNHVPKVFFTNLKKPGFIHVVNINEIRRTEKEIKICILDNHEYEEGLRDCGVSVNVDLEKNTIWYQGWQSPALEREGWVGQFGFTPEDDLEMLRYQEENRKMCLKQCAAEAQ